MKETIPLVAAILCGVFHIGTSIYVENRETLTASDSQMQYDNWQSMEAPTDTYMEPNQVYSQSQPSQGSTSWQQSAPINDNNWSPSSGFEAPRPVQQQYPSTTALPYPVQPVDNYVTTAASYQSPSTTSYTAYPQSSAGYASERGCKEGTRRSVPDEYSSFIICDNGVWIAMTCAPGTVFNALREQCMIGRSLTIAIRAHKPSQPSASSSSSSSSSSLYSQQQGSGQPLQQSQTHVQSAPPSDRYPQQAQQQQPQQSPSQQTSYSSIQSPDSSVQQTHYAQPADNRNNYTLPSYNPQQPPQQQAQYPGQSQQPQSQSYQPHVQPVRQQQAVVREYVTPIAQSRPVYQQQRQQQQPVMPVYAIPSVQQQAVYANSQPQPLPSAPQYQQSQMQQPSYSTTKPSSSQYVKAQQSPQQQASWRPASTGVAQGWRPAPASQMHQSGGIGRNLPWQSSAGILTVQQVQPSQTAVQVTPDQSTEYNQKPNANQSYLNPQPAAASTYQAPASSQQSGQLETSYEAQQGQTGGKLKITVAI